MKAFDVTLYNPYGPDEPVDTVFYDDNFSPEDVKRSLVDHDGYDPAIIVTKVGEYECPYCNKVYDTDQVTCCGERHLEERKTK